MIDIQNKTDLAVLLDLVFAHEEMDKSELLGLRMIRDTLGPGEHLPLADVVHQIIAISMLIIGKDALAEEERQEKALAKQSVATVIPFPFMPRSDDDGPATA